MVGDIQLSCFSLKAVPWCFYPDNYESYEVKSKTQTSSGYQLTLQQSQTSGWPNDITQLAVHVTYETPTRLNFKVTLLK